MRRALTKVSSNLKKAWVAISAGALLATGLIPNAAGKEMQKLPTVNVFEVALPVPDRLTAAAVNDRFELKREAADRRPAVIAPSPSDNEAAYTVPNARSLAY